MMILLYIELKPVTVNKEIVDSLVDPITVVNNGFELLKHRFENTMDSYAIAEFERIQRALDKLTAEIDLLRKED
jgi:hypothetical protein